MFFWSLYTFIQVDNVFFIFVSLLRKRKICTDRLCIFRRKQSASKRDFIHRSIGWSVRRSVGPLVGWSSYCFAPVDHEPTSRNQPLSLLTLVKKVTKKKSSKKGRQTNCKKKLSKESRKKKS
jgi:hypothetical protein